MAYGDKQRKTLAPSARRKREARQEGKVAKSQELSQWLVLLPVVLVPGPLFNLIRTAVLDVFSQASHVMSHPDQGQAVAVLVRALEVFATVALTVGGLFMLVAILVNLGQVRFLLAFKAAKPNLKRLNPIEGIKRLFSVRSLFQALKSFAKIAVLAFIGYKVVLSVAHTVIGATPVSLGPVLGFTGQSVLSLVRDTALVMLILALIDYFYQRRVYNQDLRMTKEEAKEEQRQHEGDPITRGRIRKQQYKLSRLRILAAVAQADVVITNPTHVAVALKYDRHRHAAPTVVAKGEGYMALSMKEEAFTKGVPVVEDPPLARAIHAACEVDDVIPRELYMAVAHLLAFVYSLTPDARLLGVAFRRPTSAMAL